MARQNKEGEVFLFNGTIYELRKKLGEGGFGQVYFAKLYSYTKYSVLVTRLFAPNRAVKIVDKRDLRYPEIADSEIHMMKFLNHPNIIKLYDLGKMDENSIYLFMEYANGGDLKRYIQRYNINEKEAKYLFRQTVTGAEYLHSKGIAHRDLKPSNILLSARCFWGYWTVKIADFGLSKKIIQDDEMASMCGPPKYAAPEVFDYNLQSYDGCKADMYSLGSVLHDLTTKYGEQPMPSPDCKTLYEKLKSKNPCSRPSATEVLKDKWLAEK